MTKLELTWPGKEEIFRLEPRILIEKPELSNLTQDPATQNMLIHGDNLLALKALEKDFAGKIKCVYIDPPYNTGSAFEHYDDNFEHSTWLNLMRPRLELLRILLSKDGSIWINLDDNEVFHCKVLMDEIYGRQNFVGSIVWEKADSPKMDAKLLSTRHDLILVYARDLTKLVINREKSDEIPEHYNKIDEDGKRYYLKPMRVMGGGNVSQSLYYPMIAPDGSEVWPISAGGHKTCWRWSKKKAQDECDRIAWVKSKNGWSVYYKIYADTRTGTPVQTIWPHEEVGSNRTSKAEIKALFGNNIFDTPKPEKLLGKVIRAATNSGDIVLDSFLGSGTTAAVALKMNRRFIGIEIGEHAYTHCKVRLDKIISGENYGGLPVDMFTQKQGYKFFELAPSLMKPDEFGGYMTNKEYDDEMLARAVALHKGYEYKPDEIYFWKQSQGTEKSFLFVTTNHVSSNFVASIHSTMDDDEFLIIACKSYDSGAAKIFKNIRIEKIPVSLEGKYEYGREDYNLNIVNPPTDD